MLKPILWGWWSDCCKLSGQGDQLGGPTDPHTHILRKSLKLWDVRWPCGLEGILGNYVSLWITSLEEHNSCCWVQNERYHFLSLGYGLIFIKYLIRIDFPLNGGYLYQNCLCTNISDKTNMVRYWISFVWTCPLPWHGLTHLFRDKMSAIWQTIFSDAFSWMKSFVLWLKLHWSLFLRVQLTITEHWFR